jgi:MFS superfamily sulfate permease-like transporter
MVCLNGISLYILPGQLGKLFGFAVDAKGIAPKLVEVGGKIGLTHWPTLALGGGTFAVLLLSKRFLPRLPAALVALVAAALAMTVRRPIPVWCCFATTPRWCSSTRLTSSRSPR